MASTKNRVHKLFKIDAAEHGREEAIKANDESNLEVINLGLSRTGTTSLSAALQILGFGPCHQGIDTFRSPTLREGWISILQDINTGRTTKGPALSSRIRNMMRGYRSAGDHPVNHLPAELVEAYSNAKFILATRDGGGEAWWKSFNGAVGVHFWNDWRTYLFRALLFPVGFLRRMTVQIEQNRIMWVNRYGSVGASLYDMHNADVKRLVPKNQLLVYNVKQGWEPLCEFLEVPVPQQPFPKLNEQESMKAIYFGMQMFGACAWAAYLTLIGGSVYLALRPDVVKGLLSSASRWTSKFFF